MTSSPATSPMDSVERLLEGKVVGTTSGGIVAIEGLAAMLGAAKVVRVWPGGAFFDDVEVMVGWGRKENTRRARRHAEKRGIPYVMLEDGFLRSVGLGVTGAPPLSITVDDVGMHYDASRPSRLEEILEGKRAESVLLDDPALLERARRAIDAITRSHLSKFNHSPDAPPLETIPGCKGRVLVIDQTAGDLSVRLGGAHEAGFEGMVRAALAEHPRAEVAVKIHPNVASGEKGGYLTDLFADPRVRPISARMQATSLLEQVDHVYAMTSQMGFEALLVGKPVTCFGSPFYAGWGLTDDRVPTSRRTRARSLEEVFAAAYLLYARYLDPETGERCEIERVIEHLALQREMGKRNGGRTFCVGLSPWKQTFVSPFLAGPTGAVVFVRRPGQAARKGIAHGDRLLVWGAETPPEVREVADAREVPIWYMEDGFLRSVGLGSDLVTPASLVIDRRGIYYDPGRPSELEDILRDSDFSDAEIARAAALREAIVAHGISKYNVGKTAVAVLPPEAAGKRVVLAIGQVEDDASIRLGCIDVRTNEGLIRAAREARPDAYLIFKPHPDVISGNRTGHVSPESVQGICDLILDDVSLGEALGLVDEVHTMTSLVGFESLLRGLPVTVYGLPFYAGWGLTDDRHSIGRRGRELALDELVAGTLLRYATYVSPKTGQYTTPEVILDRLRREISARGGEQSVRSPWLVRASRKALNLYRGVRRGR